jgi:hypothetical protein
LRGSWLLLSWDVDLAHARRGSALRDVGRQQLERVLYGCAFDRPPDRVAAGAARGERRAVAKSAFVPPEGGKDDTALVRLVVVVQQVVGHAARLPLRCRPDIGAPP